MHLGELGNILNKYCDLPPPPKKKKKVFIIYKWLIYPQITKT